MRLACLRREFERLLAGTLLCLLSAGLAASSVGAADEAPSKPYHAVVLPADLAPELAPIGPGLANWLGQRLGEVGLEIRQDARLRLTAAPILGVGRTPELVQLAGRAGAYHALLIDLAVDPSGIAVLLRLHDADTGQLLAVGRDVGAPENLGASVEQALHAILPALGVETRLTASTPVAGREFAAYSEALARLDAGQLGLAWKSVDGQRGRGTRALKAQVEAAASAPGLEIAKRAQWLSAAGRHDQAWTLLAPVAAPQLESAEPDAEILAAAGEAKRLQGDLAAAEQFYQRAYEAELSSPGSSPSAALGLAKTLMESGNTQAAVAPLEHAAKIDPGDPEAPRLLAEIPERAAHEKAQSWAEAGRRSASLLEVEEAQRHFDRAIASDPGIEGEVREQSARMQAATGNPEAALMAFERSIDAGGATPSRKLGIARAHRALAQPEQAREAYDEAVRLGPESPATLREAGDYYAQIGEVREGLPHLERASRLAPSDAGVQRSLARSLALVGENQRALELFEGAQQTAPAPAGDLHIMANLQKTMGNVQAARLALEQAAGMDPTSAAIQQDLAAVYGEVGMPAEQARSQQTLDLLASSGIDSREGAAGPVATGPVDHVFAALVASFPGAIPEDGDAPTPVALVGLSKEHDWSQWKAWLPEWLSPKVVDLERLADDLSFALAQHYRVDASRTPSEYNLDNVTRLSGFAKSTSLDARAVASLNMDLGVDSSFVAQVSAPSLSMALCGGDGWKFEIRRLDGQSLESADILANSACLPSLLETHSIWNLRAAGVYGLLLLWIGYLVVRGWGSLVVTAHVPENTIALFNISVSRRPRRVKKHNDLASGKADGRYRRRLRQTSLFEKKMIQGKETIFRWIPARKKPLYLTVRGPLLDSFNQALIGDFLEERTVEIKRGERVRVDFDMRPKEATVQVTVFKDRKPADQAMISVRGQPKSLRYLKEGTGFLYLHPGSYVVMAGVEDRVVESEVEINDTQALPVTIDVGQERGLLFSGCRDAVAPCLESNFIVAADYLENAGRAEEANLLRSLAHRETGDMAAASEALAAAGRSELAAELRAEHAAPEDAGTHFEQAGNPRRAAEAYRERGDLENAARAFEEAYDWDNAIDCYQTLGDNERLVEVLERSGDFFEAGRTALQIGDSDRALSALQQVDGRHPHYSEACRMLAGLLIDRGEKDFAIEKLDEAQRVGGLENFPIELQDRYGKLLEEAGRVQDALSVYAEVRRRDLHYGDVSTRIETLKQGLSRSASGGAATTASAPPPSAAAPVTSRYEILGELGRGGMGVVYKARDKNLERIVALKRLPEELKSHPTAVRLFEREARAAAALNHRNIVTIHDAGQENGNYFITMEFLEGTELDAILRKHGALTPGITARIGIQVATGLHYAHQRRIIHRDIKTANLFFTKEKVVKIMDFGLAKMLEEVRRASTVIGGTPYYMPPEQAKGGVVDHRADLYSLGVTLFQLVTGRVPFDDGDMTYHHAHTPAPDAREFVATVSAELAALLQKLMAKAPDERCQSAAEVVQVLTSVAKS